MRLCKRVFVAYMQKVGGNAALGARRLGERKGAGGKKKQTRSPNENQKRESRKKDIKYQGKSVAKAATIPCKRRDKRKVGRLKEMHMKNQPKTMIRTNDTYFTRIASSCSLWQGISWILDKNTKKVLPNREKNVCDSNGKINLLGKRNK